MTTQKPIKDAKLDIRIPKLTKDQLTILAEAELLSVSVYLQLLIDEEYNKYINTVTP